MNAWSYTSTPTTRLRAKFKHRVLYVLVLRNLTLCNILHSPVIFTLLRANILLSTLLSDTLQLQGGEREREREREGETKWKKSQGNSFVYLFKIRYRRLEDKNI
jgi:hypothetical protein